jgi:hypothetical protein
MDIRSGTRLTRTWLVTLLAGMVGAAWLPAGAQAFAVSKWEAGTCTESSCADGSPTAFYTQAAGHPNFGITDFKFADKEVAPLDDKPEGNVRDVRVDLPAGLAVNPEATEKCTEQQLDDFKCPPGSQVGEDEATGTATVLDLLGLSPGATVTEHFPVYNMVRNPGEPSRFGVEINSETLEALTLLGDDLQGHLYLEGGISWHSEPETSENSGVTSGDYHAFFKIENIPTQPEIVESRLIFWGVPQEHSHVGTPTAFITLPSTCIGKPVTTLHVDSYEDPGVFQAYTNETPVTATGCDQLAFDPSLSLSAETSQSDQPDGVSAELHVPQSTAEPSKPNSPDVQSAEVTLPEGMTLNPAAAQGLVGCSSAQFAAGGCPAASQIGSFAVDAPGIPDGSLAGGVYVGSPAPGKGPESGEEFRIFLLGETPKVPGAEGEGGEYGVGLRLEGRVSASVATGRLTATFAGAPQVPVEDLTLHFRGGPRAPLANPLSCGPVAPSGAITPYGGEPPASAAAHGFVVDANGAGGACPAPLPFSLVQSLAPQSPAHAGAYDPAAFNLTRSPGQQYLSKIVTTLPPGLLGSIASVPLCAEAQANTETCPASSQIGTVSVAAGAGSEPYTFSGRAYLTGPYEGAPYGLSVVVPAVAGPYDLGELTTRAGITVGLYSGRVTVTSTLPSIFGGVPLRLRSLSVAVNRQDFLFNPTSCAPLATESLLSSTSGAAQSLSSPFQVGDCGALAFKPSLTVSTGGRPTKAGGASLTVEIAQGAGQANIREVQLQLPRQLPSRQTTLQNACPAARFEAGPPPGACASTARVGTATVSTPVLPGVLTGPAYLISHGGEAFPDLDLVLSGDGVQIVLVGHTHISPQGIITSTFENLPDVPISSVTVNLPMGPNSVLAANNGRLCDAGLLAPTTIVAQSGAKITQSPKMAVTGCAMMVISHRLRGRRVMLTAWAPEAGRVSVSARGSRRVSVSVKRAGEVKLSLPLSARVTAALHRRGHGLELRIGFVPRSGRNTSALALSLR